MHDLYNRRKELGLTLEQVGDMCGVGKSTVRKWENGMINNMGRDKIVLLAKALEVSPLFILNAETSEKILSDFEKRILSYLDKLNSLGKEKALERIEELTYIPLYTSCFSGTSSELPSSSIQVPPSNTTLRAAHSIPDSSDTDMENDIKMMLDDSNW